MIGIQKGLVHWMLHMKLTKVYIALISAGIVYALSKFTEVKVPTLDEDVMYVKKNSFIQYKPYIPVIYTKITEPMQSWKEVKIEAPSDNNVLIMSDDEKVHKIVEKNRNVPEFWRSLIYVNN